MFFRLVYMYTSACLPEMNEKVLALFKKQDCKLRIVIATFAFGMGIDCPDIRQVIHMGLKSSEMLCLGNWKSRQGWFPIESCFINKPSKHVEKLMKEYCTCCRRQLLF